MSGLGGAGTSLKGAARNQKFKANQKIMRDKMKSQDDGGGRAPAIFVFCEYALLTLLALLAAPFARAAVTVTNAGGRAAAGTKLMDITYVCRPIRCRTR